MAKSYVIRLLRWIETAAFAEDDDFARHQGWQVVHSRLCLIRTYRSPAFDQLACCPMCAGTGSADDKECAQCSGTGRLNLRQVSQGGGY